MSRVRLTVQQSKERREWAIDCARMGLSNQEIIDRLGIALGTFKNWRVHHPEYAARFDAARQESMAEKLAFDGTFIHFRDFYLNMRTTWFQRLIVDAMEAAHPGEVVLVLIPPEHGKTTLLEDWCTYKLCTDPSFRITVASETVDHGVKILDRVRQRLEPEGPTPRIHRDFGPLAPEEGSKNQVWTAKHFNVTKKQLSDERDYSMHSVGITGRVQGTRCDLLLLDDMQDVKSLDQTEKYTEIVVQSFLSRPSMFGRTVIIGTRVGEFDVYRQLIDRGIPDKIVLIPAYNVAESPTWPAPDKKPDRDDPTTWAPEGTRFLWPEKYDGTDGDGFHRYRYAALRYRVGEVAWARNYMQRPEAAAIMTFDEATTERMQDETRSVMATPRPLPNGEQCQVIIGLDPSIGGGNGVIAAAMYPDRLDVLHCRLDYGLSKYSQIIDIVEEECHRFSSTDCYVGALVVEDKAFQRGLLKDDRLEELQSRFGFRVVPNTTGREKADPDIGVAAMPISMIRREITIPWADQASIDNMDQLLGHLHIWRPGVPGNKLPQDMTMALWFIWRYWRATTKDKITLPRNAAEQFTGTPSPLRRPRVRVRRQRRPYRALGTYRGGR